KELLSYLRDPRSRVTLIGPPLMQLLIFSYAVTLDVSNVRLGVLDEDAGRASHELVQRLDGAAFVDELVFVASEAELAELIDRREVLAGLRFPADFSRNVSAQRPAIAQVVLDGRRANAAQITMGYLNTVAATMGAELRQRETGAAISRTEVRHWFNPNLIYRWFVVPSLSGILAMLIALLVTALSIARERELGTFDQLLVSPAAPIEIVIGKTVPALVIGTVLGSVMIAAGVLLFRIPFTGSAPWLLSGLVLFILSMVGIGLMLSSICRTQQQAILGTFSIGVPLVLISGFATPVENMPDWLQIVATASPLKYYLIIVRGSFLKALPPTDLIANMWPMALIALVTLSSAVVFVKRNLQ
ncbi:MAG TPA: ABC transporter permease, partial [Gammaproteobacteria bacterium]|nr:ABC transporter permease [Gammaproteobacteria bacterium]